MMEITSLFLQILRMNAMKTARKKLRFYLIWILIAQCKPVLYGQKFVVEQKLDSIRVEMTRAKGKKLTHLRILYAGLNALLDSASSRKMLEDNLIVAEKEHNTEALLDGYRSLLIMHYGHRNLATAFGYGKRYVDRAMAEDKLLEAGNNLVLMGKYWVEQRNFDSANAHFNRAEMIFSRINNIVGIAEITDRRGMIEVFRNRFDEARELFLKALDLLVDQDERNVKGVIYYHLGYLYFVKGDFDLAAANIHKAIELWEPFGPDVGIAQKWNTLEMLGVIYFKLKDYERALKFHREALSVRRYVWEGQLHEDYNLSFAYSYNNIAEAHRELGRLDSALFYGDRSLRIKLRKATNASAKDIGNSYLVMSKLHNDLHNKDLSKLYADSAIYYYLISGHKESIAEAYLQQAELVAEDNMNKAFSSIRNALENASEVGAKSVLRDAYFQQASLYEKMGDWYNSLQSFKKYIELSNKISNAEVVARVAEQTEKYESEKKTLQIQHLKTENERNRKLSSITRTALLAMTLLAILSLLFVWLYRKNARNKERALAALAEVSSLKEQNYRNELEMKNLELRRLIDTIKNKNQMLETIRSVMLEEIRNNCKAPVEVFNRTVKSIQSHIVNEQDWEVLQKKIEEVEGSFSGKLLKIHPGLTPNDIRLCSYFKLNLGTKEVASLMNVSEETVRKQRYRLRKKLGLSDEHIHEYLNKI